MRIKELFLTPTNDWPIKQYLMLALSLPVFLLVLIGLSTLNFDIPLLRQIAGFLFLTMVPGILLLRIFRIHHVNIIESYLYTVGLSLIVTMSVGVLLNFALPPVGFEHPLTLLPVIIAFSILTLVLLPVAYVRDKNFQPAVSINSSSSSLKPNIWARFNPYLLALLLPALTILGTSLVNAYQNNLLLIIYNFIIALIILLAALKRFIPPSAYPFTIFMMSLSLIYQTTLISSNLVGSDIHIEYYISNLVLDNGIWDSTIPLTVNSCLSLVIIPPVYSLVTNMDIIWLFKVVHPLLFVLVPLAIFRLFRIQMNSYIALLATLFFITMPMFTMDMAQLVRQQVSQLFFALVLLLLVERRLTALLRACLIIIFGFGVVVSHYGLGTGYIGYLVCAAFVLLIVKSSIGRVVWQWLIGKQNPLPPDLQAPGAFNRRTWASVVIVSLAFMLLYYGNVASGSATSGIESSARNLQQAASGITSSNLAGSFQFLNPFLKEPLTRTAIGLDFTAASAGGKVWRIFQYLVELFLIAGFLRLIFRPSSLGRKLKAEYISMVMVSVIILLGIYLLPTWSYGMGTSRIWQITLLLASPLFIFGGETIALGIVRLIRLFRRSFTSRGTLLGSLSLQRYPFLIILIPYFVFNSGLVFELSRSQTTHFIDIPYSIALSNHRVDISTSFTRQDVTAAHWLINTGESSDTVHTDYHSNKLLYWQLGLFKSLKLHEFYHDIKQDQTLSPGYVYLNSRNVKSSMITIGSAYAARESISFADVPWFTQALGKSDKIYDNGGAQVLLNK